MLWNKKYVYPEMQQITRADGYRIYKHKDNITKEDIGHGSQLVYFPELIDKIENKFYIVHKEVTEEERAKLKEKNWHIHEKFITSESGALRKIILIARYDKNE